jgi:uncharacterized paraquat-inducible protein A
VTAYARQCDKCGMLVTPRGGATPRFCPRCGHQLLDSANCDGQCSDGLPQATAGSAVASLVFGVLSLPIPMIGLILGIAAIAAGAHARKQIEHSGGQLGGTNVATAGIALGIVGVSIWILVCAAAL